MPIEYRSIRRTLANGSSIEAPVGIWLIALLSVIEESIPSDKHDLINERVAKMLEDQKAPAIITPNVKMPKNYVLDAEPGRYFSSHKGE